MPVIVWHRNDLRLEDNPPLFTAAEEEAIPIYIYDPKENLGSASKWWLDRSLRSLQQAYEKRGGTLLIRKGDPKAILQALVQEMNASAIHINARYDPYGLKVDAELDLPLKIFNGNHLINPKTLLNKSGKPFAVFTPFWKALQKEFEQVPLLEAPSQFKQWNLPSESIDSLDLLPKIPWTKTMEKTWTPGRQGALKRLEAFKKREKAYSTLRDFPFEEGTSRLSPHLHFGELSPLEVWNALPNAEPYLRQLAWREFGTYFVYHNPKTLTQNWNEKFDTFPWKNSPEALKKWQKGETGFPIVDAAMKQLWQTGWMHNRLRMVVASFLIKDLMIDWRQGAEWFWDTLLDADVGNNTMGWQWVAGCGPDAAPFFRIFNPILQGEKFDPEGAFVKSYLPELKNLPPKWIHKPWETPESELKAAGITLGSTYPKPIVDHAQARDLAMEAYKSL